ncbi:CTLH/CRA C-terminal to lish motif domain-containing protein [Calycina marina]|uniref:GID complex catalytic subunit 2 n=1 Tax=Calycina marina TaxID=1763456 RepID=A0A9P8CFG7_9HELO|nr:CTLH/CRA C-terminal to lish motif domain-containing protein [Calycina marina]
MDILLQESQRLHSEASLQESIEDVEKIIQHLERAKQAIVADPNSASITLAKLQNPIKNGCDQITADLTKLNRAQAKYGKVLKENFPAKALPTDYDALASHPSLVNRAIAMHLLREGQFAVASIFVEEAQNSPPHPIPTPVSPHPADSDAGDFTSLKSQELQHLFSNMYYILGQLKTRNIHPAIDWARQNSAELERRGSTLEFELSKLQYIWLFQGPAMNSLPADENNGLHGALRYARANFGRFQNRFLPEIQQLATAMIYAQNLRSSPYHHTFSSSSSWSDVCTSFTREFCSLLGLSAESPLYIAATAGAVALPALLKLALIVREKRTEWTTKDELPVEIPLPSSMIFHAIFVCPVSKEQTTDNNPPMMMPCGHVVAKESLNRLSKGGKFKCPYCPNESQPKDAREIIL